MNKIVISDTSCLIALSKIKQLSLLKDLYEEILITKEVYREYGEPLPPYITILEPKDKTKQKITRGYIAYFFSKCRHTNLQGCSSQPHRLLARRLIFYPEEGELIQAGIW